MIVDMDGKPIEVDKDNYMSTWLNGLIHDANLKKMKCAVVMYIDENGLPMWACSPMTQEQMYCVYAEIDQLKSELYSLVNEVEDILDEEEID